MEKGFGYNKCSYQLPVQKDKNIAGADEWTDSG